MTPAFPVQIDLARSRGVFADGWLEASADVDLISDRSVALDFFLPGTGPDRRGKVIALSCQGARVEVALERGEVFRWGPVEPRDGRLQVHVLCDAAEPPDPVDKRSLGVFLARVWTGTGPDSLPLADLLAAAGAGRGTDPPAPPGFAEAPAPAPMPAAGAQALSAFDQAALAQLFDADFYAAGFAPGTAPADPVRHYWTTGRHEGREAAPWFSTRHYLAAHPDVAAAGMDAFLHYALAGRAEGRHLVRLGRQTAADVYRAQAAAVAPGPEFEELDPAIAVGRRPLVKALAFYLPQFHPVAVNDRHWGAGFTEWRNLPRALPRYVGHVQPRIPRDLGPYRLDEGGALARQIAMARAAGVHGFCVYHYWFDGDRVLEAPMERFLSDPSLDMPFCLMWANENWTRTWDGADREVILAQHYAPAQDRALVADFARHMADPRYIRLQGRPLLFLYRPGQIPDAAATLARWRGLFAGDHGLEPLIFMAQGFGDLDPRVYGLDGAIEFPPHKLCQDLPHIAARLEMLDDGYAGHIVDYAAVVARSLAEPAPDFPLIRTATPSWDNEARRPGRGMILHGGTPRRFEGWMAGLVQHAVANPVAGEAIVAVNAWNEWAEGAVLEPDVHHGGAFLNALARAVHGVARPVPGQGPLKVLIVGHDANANGAQMLALHVGQRLRQVFGVEVAYLLGEGGPLVADYARVGAVHVAAPGSPEAAARLQALQADGVRAALTNTTPAGRMVPALKQAGFHVVSLIHELPALLRSYGLQDAARAIAEGADRVIFPAEVVQEGFAGFAGQPVRHAAEILPQGLYAADLLDDRPGDRGLRAELGLAREARIVLGVGYADLRKGIDRFVAAALSICAQDAGAVFLWVGAPAAEVLDWFAPEIAAAGLAHRIRIMGHRSDVARFYRAADVFYLSSREDPFPSVVLEALAAGLPVVGHAGCGGCDGLVARHGRLVSSGDPLAAVAAIRAFLQRPGRGAARAAAARRAEIATAHDFDAYAFGLLTRLAPGLPAVSAVVPNYNYQDHIGPRLRTVFDQHHPLREVIVLDDASPDDSLSVIRATAEAAGRRIALQVNRVNGGSPFPQWKKGAAMARGDYVWIAEADDLATPDLVGRLVARMQAAGAVLGFCDSRQMDGADRPLGDSYRPYMNELDPGAFDRPFDMDGRDFLARHLAVRNVILNVSGVIFRRDALMAAFAAVGDAIMDYRVAGDWRLYVELCARGGKVSYLPEAMNAHRRHPTSVTHALQVDRHLAEIAGMHAVVREKVALGAAMVAAQGAYLERCRAHLEGRG